MHACRLIFILALAPAAFADMSGYKLDLQGPGLVFRVPRVIAFPTRVEVHLSGPRVYIDEAVTPWSLQKRVPVCTLTNDSEIETLISILGAYDNTERITNVSKHVGYTYRFLLFDDWEKTVMHFRVFKATDFQTVWCDVYPRSDVHYGYFNDKIGSWLTSRLTNSFQHVSVTQTNLNLKTSNGVGPPAVK